jgi:hypothetical protein
MEITRLEEQALQKGFYGGLPTPKRGCGKSFEPTHIHGSCVCGQEGMCHECYDSALKSKVSKGLVGTHWEEIAYGTCVWVNEAGEIKARLLRGYAGCWSWGTRDFINLASAKKAVEENG